MSELDRHRTPEQEVVRWRRDAGPADEAGPAEVRPASVDLALAEYFRAVDERLNYLEYGDPSEYVLRVTSTEVGNSPLRSIWTPPRFKYQNEGGDDVPLDSLLRDPNRCLLVLAEPGCGKSTLARFLTCFFIERYCQGSQPYFGILVPLSALRTSDLTYHEAVAECAVRYVGLAEQRHVVEALIRNLENACVIFDGLDELPIRRGLSAGDDIPPLRRDAVLLIRALRYVQVPTDPITNPVRCIVTSRTRDYFEDRESTLGTVPQYILAQFSPEQMDTAIRQWHRAAKDRMEEARVPVRAMSRQLDERASAIRSALREHFDLASVCLSPLMLNILLTVFTDAKDLPSSVSQLCSRAVRWFLVDKHSGTGQWSFAVENAQWLLESITSVGWYCHTRVVRGEQKTIFDADLRKCVRDACTDSNLLRSGYEALENAVTQCVAFIRRGHGILVKVSQDEFDFAHNVFREVMAGRALARIPVAERREFALHPLWHGPIRYWAGLRAADPDGLYEISAFVSELKTEVEAGELYASLARAEMLVEVRAIVPASKYTRDLKNQISEVRSELCDLLPRSDLEHSVRVRIGDLLAVLGDPALETPVLERVQWFAGGEYRVGRDLPHRTRIAKYQSCPSSPPFKGRLSSFGIGRFLVTNREFEEFIKDNGYARREFWPGELAWRWASGDTDTVDMLIQRARDVAATHFSSELAGQRLVPDEIPERCVQMIRRKLPLYWIDPSFNRANHPVVGVNWWEAVAFCSWLGQLLRRDHNLDSELDIRLPSEAEWETAARLCGDGGRYPWVTGEPQDCAHVRASSTRSPVLRPCAVGLFRSVSSRYPVFDLVGNVWEWTSSKARPYSAATFDQTADFEGIEDRIARGSSWLSSEEEATEVTFRSFDPPYNAYEDLGFRVAVSAQR